VKDKGNNSQVAFSHDHETS